MTPQELDAAGQELFGRNFKAPLARALKVNYSTLWRWLTGELRVPGPVEAAVTAFLREKRQDARTWPDSRPGPSSR